MGGEAGDCVDRWCEVAGSVGRAAGGPPAPCAGADAVVGIAPRKDQQQARDIRDAGLLAQAVGSVLAVFGRDKGGGAGQGAGRNSIQPLGAAGDQRAARLHLLAMQRPQRKRDRRD